MSLFNSLGRLIDKHGIEEVLTAIDDFCFIQAINARLLKKDEKSARYWTRIGNQIKKIKTK